jgi:transposase-like protein
MINTPCPKCGSDKPQYAHGKTSKDNPRYRCSECKRTYILMEPKYSEEFKRNAIKVYLEGNSGRAVGRILGISKNTIWGWLNEYSQGLPSTSENDVDIAEMDELYTHIKKGK